MKTRFQNCLKFIVWVLPLSLLMHSSMFPQNNPYKLNIAVDASKTKFDSQLGFDSPVGYGGEVSYSLHERFNAGLSFSTFTTKKAYDVIGDLEELNISTRVYQLQLQYLFFHATPSLRFFVSSGFGFITFKTPERRINLGALGQMTIPEKSDTRELFSGGITVTKQVNRRINIQLTPEIFIFKNSGDFRTNFSLAGGIGLGIL